MSKKSRKRSRRKKRDRSASSQAAPRASRARREEAMPSTGEPERDVVSQRRPRIAIALLLLAAAAYYSWNAYTFPTLSGYDAKRHAEYVAIIVDQGRLPHPLEGWSTFHPPLYHLLASLVVPHLRPIWTPKAMLGMRGISALAMLAAGFVSFRLVMRFGGGLAVACVATALTLFVPCAQLAATMVGNEGLATGVAALALLALVKLQANPQDLRAAAVAGLMGGLALATKYTGFFVAVACVVPFCRADLDRRMLRALVLCAVVGAVIAGPVYVRNIMLTGSPVPMTRHLEPMKSAEDTYIIRERKLVDYLWINPASLLRPTLYHVRGQEPSRDNRNPAMTNVWGLAYASMWYDAFGHRLPVMFHRDGIYAGPVLTLLGIVPTAMLVAGFLIGLRELVRRRGRTPDAPLVVMALAGLLSFFVFTLRAPSAVAVKASYLLPLVAPAAVFFARGVGLLRTRARVAVLLISAAAALAAVVVFANGLVFPFLWLPSPESVVPPELIR